MLQCVLKSPSEIASLKVRQAVFKHTVLSHKRLILKNLNKKNKIARLFEKICFILLLLRVCRLRVRHDGSIWSDSESSLLCGGRGSRAFCLQHPLHLHCVQRCPADTEHQVGHTFIYWFSDFNSASTCSLLLTYIYTLIFINSALHLLS